MWNFEMNLDEEYGGAWFAIWRDGADYLDDQHITEALGDLLPKGFDEAAESIFEFEGDPDDGRKLLLNAGFTESKIEVAF